MDGIEPKLSDYLIVKYILLRSSKICDFLDEENRAEWYKELKETMETFNEHLTDVDDSDLFFMNNDEHKYKYYFPVPNQTKIKLLYSNDYGYNDETLFLNGNSEKYVNSVRGKIITFIEHDNDTLCFELINPIEIETKWILGFINKIIPIENIDSLEYFKNTKTICATSET